MIESLPAPARRKLYLTGEISSEMAAAFYQEMDSINDSDRVVKLLYQASGISWTPEPIQIIIDSPGGCVYSSFGIIDYIEKSTTPVETIVAGMAMSGAFLILIAAENRKMHKNSTLMYHSASLIISEMISTESIREMNFNTQKLQRRIESFVVNRTKLSSKLLSDISRRKKDYYFDSVSALKFGIVNGIECKRD